MNISSHSHNHFSTTRWSVVMQLAAAQSGDADHALAELAQRYWYPVYAYVRRCGHAPCAAEDIARCFLTCLMREFRSGQSRPPQGHFRRYLLDQLNAFLGSDWRELIGTEAAAGITPPADLEARNQHDNALAVSPEQAYQHAFALEVIARALKRLRAEATQTGHLPMYTALERHLAHDPAAGEYELIAARLQSRPLALVVALKRLRQRFRELVGQELADTVTSAEDLATEQAALHAILSEMQMPS
jgi:hypothetical protein